MMGKSGYTGYLRVFSRFEACAGTDAAEAAWPCRLVAARCSAVEAKLQIGRAHV